MDRLIHLNQIRLEGDVAVIGPGAKLGNVYVELVKSHRAVPIGNCRSVGAGGQSLAGGCGFASRKHGILIDQIIEYEVVLANGEVVTASTESHPDLFHALRGFGAGNFGIVTQIKAQTFPVENVWVIKRFYSRDRSTFSSILKWLTSNRNSHETTFRTVIDAKGINIQGQSFAPFPDLVPFPTNKSHIQQVPFAQTIEELTIDTVPQPKKYKSRMFSRPLTDQSIEVIWNALDQIQPFNGHFSIEISQLKGSGNTQLPWKNSTYWMDLSIHWANEHPQNNYTLGIAQLQILYSQLLPNADPWCYSGSMDSEISRKHYYGDYFETLEEVKRKYDPENCFVYAQGVAT